MAREFFKSDPLRFLVDIKTAGVIVVTINIRSRITASSNMVQGTNKLNTQYATRNGLAISVSL